MVGTFVLGNVRAETVDKFTLSQAGLIYIYMAGLIYIYMVCALDKNLLCASDRSGHVLHLRQRSSDKERSVCTPDKDLLCTALEKDKDLLCASDHVLIM